MAVSLKFFLLRSLCILLCGFSAHDLKAVINGHFSSDLLGWSSAGDVAVSSGFALVGDGTGSPGTLFQSVETGPGLWELRFEFANSLSGPVAPGSFSELGAATLYLSDVPFVSPSDPSSYDSFIALFDIDVDGTFNVHPDASIDTLSSRPGWSAFSLQVNSSGSYLTPYFQVLEQNGQSDDSALALDDFTIVPEARFHLFALLILAIVLFSRKPYLNLSRS